MGFAAIAPAIEEALTALAGAPARDRTALLAADAAARDHVRAGVGVATVSQAQGG
jgi:hypothetical protein